MAKRKLALRKQNKKKTAEKYERRIKEEHIWDRIFLLQIKKSLYVIIIWIASMLAHNLIFRFTGTDESFFTTISIYVVPLYLLISIIYTLAKHKRIEG